MKKRTLSMLLALLLVFQFANFAGVTKHANAADEGNAESTLNDDKGFSVTNIIISDSQVGTAPPGDVIAEIKDQLSIINPDYQFQIGKSFYVKYEWLLDEEHSYKAGDTKVISLPSGLTLAKEENGEIKKSDGTKVGTYSATGNDLTITFNENVVDSSGEDEPTGLMTDGYIYFWAYIDESKVSEGDNEVIIDFVKDEFPITIKPKTPGEVIVKHNKASKKADGWFVDWTIDVNTSLDKINNAVLTDRLPEGLELASHVTIQKLIVDLTKTSDNITVDPEFMKTIDQATFQNNEIVIEFKDEPLEENPLQSAYRITFATKVTDPDTTKDLKFPNKAVLNGTTPADTPVYKEAHSEANFKSIPLFGKAGIKSTSNSVEWAKDKYKVNWTIQYNFGENVIAKENAVIYDRFTNTHQLVNGTSGVKVYEVEVDEDGNLVSGGPKIEISDSSDYEITLISNETLDNKQYNGFKIAFQDSINKAYLIEYTTETTEDVYNNSTIRNYVSDKEDTPGLSIPIHISQQFFGKSHKNSINYKEKKVTWTVDINKAGYTLPESFVYDDTFGVKGFNNETTGKGLRLVPGSIKVYIDGSNEAAASGFNVEYKSADSQDETVGFKINFSPGSDKKHVYKVTYETYFDYDEMSDSTTHKGYTNNGKLQGFDATINIPDQSKGFEASTTWDWENNGEKFGFYDPSLKEITWNIGINYNQKVLNNVTITDTLKKIEQYVKDSLKVYEVEVVTEGSKGSTKIADTALTNEQVSSLLEFSPELTKGETLTWTFKDPIPADKAYLITFKTSVDGSLIDNSFENIINEAKWTYENTPNEKVTKTLTGDVNIPKAGKYVSKTGKQVSNDSLEIKWTVNINENQSLLENVKLTDKLDNTENYGQIYLQESFELYEAAYEEDNGNFVWKRVGEELKKGTDYTLTFNSESTDFTLEFLGKIENPNDPSKQITAIDKGYSLSYSSLVSADPGVNTTVKNKVVLTTETSVTTGDTTGENGSAAFQLSGSGAGANQYKADIEITKKEKNTSEKVEGIQFQLLRASSNKVYRTSDPTDNNGNTSFKNVPYGNYILKEVEHPHYYLDASWTDEQLIIKIDNKEKLEIVVNNEEKQKGSLTIVKTENDEHGKLLPGAEFTIYEDGDNANGPTAKKGTTGQDGTGKLVFNDLYQDVDYWLEETKAPYGYNIIGANPMKVSLSKGEISKELSISNTTKPTGEINVVKVANQAGNKPLAGAVFELKNTDYPDQKFQNVVTDENGKASFKNVPYGNYEIKEVTAPFGYKVNVNAHSVTVNDTDASPTVTVTNDPGFGEIEVKKIAKNSNPEKPLAGAEFILYPKEDKNNKDFTYTGTTGADGILVIRNSIGDVITDLPVGEYILKETKAPIGYILNNTEYKVEIKDGDKATLTVENLLYIPGPIFTPTPTPEPTPEPTEPVKPTEPVESGEPTPTPSPGAPEPTPSIEPTPSPVPTPKPEKPVTKEETPEETPVEGEVEVPDNKTTKPGQPPKNGTLEITPDGKWTYTPKPGFKGDDSFTIIVTDEDGNEEELFYEITVEEVPRGGVETPNVDKLPKTGEDSHLLIQLLGAAIAMTGIVLLVRRRFLIKK